MKQLKLDPLLRSACLLALLGCGDGGITRPGLPGPPAALKIVSGDEQSAIVGTEITDPLIVQLTDSEGRAVPGQLLNFRVVAGGGSVFAGAALTNAEGKAQERWTLGTTARDTQRVEVRAVDPVTGEALVFATFRAVGRAGPAASVQKASVDSAHTVVATGVTPLPRVRVADQYDNAVGGAAVTFIVSSGGGTVAGASQATNEDGHATVGGWTLGPTTGTSTLTAEVAAPSPLSVVFTAVGVPADAAELFIEQPAAGAQAGAPFVQQPRIGVHDMYGNPVPNATEAVTVTVSEGASVVGNTTVTPSAGVATFTDVGLTGDASSSYVLTYSATLAGVIRTVTQTIALVPGVAANLELHVPAAGASGGVPFETQPVVRIVDGSGNLVGDATHAVTLAVDAGEGSIIGTSTVSAVQGVAQFSDVGITGPAGTYSLSYSASVGDAVRTVAQPIAVTPGTPTQYIVASSAGSVEVGTPVTLNAQLSDADGTPVSWAGELVTWSSTGAAGTFEPATSLTNSTGIATVAFTPDTILAASTATITATDADARSGSVAIPVTPGAAAKLAFVTQPSNTGYLIVLPAVSVAIQDRYGNTVTSDTREVELAFENNPSGAALAGGAPIAATSGVATFRDLTVNRAGSGYTLLATSSGLPPTTSSPFDVSALGVVTTHTAPLTALHVTGGQVYYSDNVSVSRVAATGGSQSVMNVACFRCYIENIFSDGTYIYYTRVMGANYKSLSILRIPLMGGAAVTVHDNSGGFAWFLRDVDFDGRNLYYAGFGGLVADSGTIRVGVADGDTLRLLTGPRYPLAVADGLLYFVEDAAIKTVPVDGGTPTTVVSDIGSAADMLVVNGTIYWGGGTVIKSAPITGGTVTTRTTALTEVRRMVSDGTALYVNDAGSLRRFDLSSFAATTIIENDAVESVALDAESVYWTSNPSSGEAAVKKAQK